MPWPSAFRETTLRLLDPADVPRWRRVGRSLTRHLSEAGLYVTELSAPYSELTAIAKDLRTLQWMLRHDTGGYPDEAPEGAPQRLARLARRWAGEVGTIARSIERELAAAEAEMGGDHG